MHKCKSKIKEAKIQFPIIRTQASIYTKYLNQPQNADWLWDNFLENAQLDPYTQALAKN